MAVVSAPGATEESEEYVFILDSENAQLQLVDAVLATLLDLHVEIPGYNGVFLGGRPTAVVARDSGTEVVAVNFGLGALQVVCTPLAGDSCPTPSVLRTIEVGTGPERLVLVGSRAYVTRPRAGQVVEVDLDGGAILGLFEVGGNPRGIAVTADGTRLYVADSATPVLRKIDLRDRSIHDVPVGSPTRDVFISPNPEWVYALRHDRGSLLVLDPATDTVVNTNPDGPPGIEPDLVLPGAVTGMAFVTFTAEESATVGEGQFAFVTSSDGSVYAVHASGEDAHELVDRSKPSTPSVSTPPTFSEGTTAVAVTAAVPRILGYDQPPGYGIVFSTGRRVVRTEGWGLIYEGPIPPAQASRGRIDPDGSLVSFDVRFRDLVIQGTDERMVQDGDLAVLLDAPVPRAGVDCSAIRTEASGRLRRWTVRMVEGQPDRLALSPEIPDAALPPVQDCYQQSFLRYEIRVRGAWAVVGTASGYQGRAPECPRDLTDCTGFVYRNPFFSLTIQQGAEPSIQGQRWGFTVIDGVNRVTIPLSSTLAPAGLPRAAAFSRRPGKMLYVLDEGDESLTLVNAKTLIPVAAIR
jgi:hypothetical protein